MAGVTPNSQTEQHLFTPVSNPKLLRIGSKPNHQFLRDREQYLRHVEDAAASGAKIKAVSIKASIDVDLLESLIELSEFNDVTKLDELTDENLKDWLQEHGFNFDEPIKRVRDDYHNNDYSKVGFEPINVHSADSKNPQSALDKFLPLPNQQETDSVDMDIDPNYSNDSPLIISALAHDSTINAGHDKDYDDKKVVVGHEDPKATDACLRMAIENAVENGLPADQHEKLCPVISDFKGIFRTKLGSNEPENFDPMVIKLKPDAK